MYIKNITKTLVYILLSVVIFTQSLKAQNYNVLEYGAVNDTSKLSTSAFNKAIEACSLAGGGKVFIPAGRYKTGTIILQDNVELYLERGAILYASTNQKDFPRQKQPSYRSQKDPGGWYALIYAEGATNIGIGGKGTIDGQGAWQTSRHELLRLDDTDQFGLGDRDGRPRNILLISCKDVSVEGVTMLSSGIWNQHYLNCEDVLVNNIQVFNHSNRNNDAIDIDGCRRFILSNSIFDTDDDGITLKSTGSAGCEDVTITNCIVSSYANAIKCGTESTGGFKNITISNCVIKPSRTEAKSFIGMTPFGTSGITLEIVDGGIMDGVSINNVVIEGTQCPIYVRLANRARKYREDVPEPPVGQIKNIQISNITAYNTGNYSSSITGIPGASIENISLSNINIVNKGGVSKGDYLTEPTKVSEDEKEYPDAESWKILPSYGFFIRHVKYISMVNIRLASVHPDIRIPVIGIDVNNFFVRDFNLDKITDKINFQFIDVKNYDIESHKIKILH